MLGGGREANDSEHIFLEIYIVTIAKLIAIASILIDCAVPSAISVANYQVLQIGVAIAWPCIAIPMYCNIA
jgi:hypothetical protein